jgi:hypothetical protein
MLTIRERETMILQQAVLFSATYHDPQRIIRQWALQRQDLFRRRGHPGFNFILP